MKKTSSYDTIFRLFRLANANVYFSDIEKLSNMYFLSGKVQSHWVLLIEAPDDLFVSSNPFDRKEIYSGSEGTIPAGIKRVGNRNIHTIVFCGQHASMCQVESTC